MKITEAEIRSMFGDSGNFVDYWLNVYGPPDNERWHPADEFLRGVQAAEVESWDPEDETTESLMKHEFIGGGGLTGATPELLKVRAELVRTGQRTLDWEHKLGRLSQR